MLEFELSILDAIQLFAGHELIDSFWVLMTHLGDAGLVWVILSIALFVHPKTRKVGVMCAFAIIMSALVTNVILKNIIERARPFNYRELDLLINIPKDFSFPSGHTSAAFATAFVLLREKLTLNNFKVYIPALILAALTSFSRMYLYVHFPTDILASVVLAYLYSLIATEAGRKLI